MNDKKKTKFINHPQYPGGPKALTAFIYAHLRYPEAAVAHGTEGVVFVEYDIDHRGVVVATRVIQGIGHGCDEEAERVVRMLRFDVAKNRGLHVLFHQKAKIQFKKPVPKPAPLPTSNPVEVTYQYTVTPAVTEPPPPPQKEQSNVIQYTIKIG